MKLVWERVDPRQVGPNVRVRRPLGVGLGPGGVVGPPITRKERKKERKSKAEAVFVPFGDLGFRA